MLGLSVRLDWIRPGREFVKSFSLFPTFLNIHKAYPVFQTGYRRIGRAHFILPGEEKGEGLRKHSLWGQAGMAIWTPALETTGKMLLQSFGLLISQMGAITDPLHGFIIRTD